ncbi:alpha/beta fold hydrolase [Lysobacter sp. M15]|uniref:alpha/beta fold hydrolase n=1 Tax=Lysobacter sp. M15 TaxID=2916837 RepID=UPI001F568C49|nr:alpha/beta fold hydrolase [Lysobacter sp. M15]
MLRGPDWLDRAEFPFVSRFWPGRHGNLHYVDEGQGETLLFVHGNPTWSFMFRKQIAALRDRYRCVAIDHLGFGLSDKPKAAPYGPRLHSENLSQFISVLDLRNLTLVLHDWGGPIGMAYALDHPDNVARLVIANTHFWSLKGIRGAEIFSRVVGGPIGRVLCRRFNAFPRYVMKAVYGRSGTLPPEIHRHYMAPFLTPDSRHGPYCFAKAIIGESEWLAGLWSRRHILQTKPLQIIWGMEDPVGTPDKLRRWEAAFPDHRTAVLDDFGHFVPEQLGSDMARIVAAFVEEVGSEVCPDPRRQRRR